MVTNIKRKNSGKRDSEKNEIICNIFIFANCRTFMYYKKSSNKLTKVIQEKENNGIIKRKEKVSYIVG